MKLGTVLKNGRRHAALVDGDKVFVASDATLESIIETGKNIRDLPGEWSATSSATFDVPVRPEVVLCTGHNYEDHYAEKSVNRAVEAKGLEFFLKAGQTIADPDAEMILDPRVTGKLDQETELAFVIGKAGRNISKEHAMEHVFGYLVVNDVTARDRQVSKKADGNFVMELGTAKNFDGSTRLSSFIITADEIGDPQTLNLTTTINGQRRQSNTTANMIHSVADIIVFFSSVLTLKPGTIISTGTPSGSGWGHDVELGGKRITPPGCVPGAYLKDGDVVVSEVEKIGRLEFKVRAIA
jgi:2-keto-4-pentenoate hydratase/2-oxohepta-3-ene-1,7-dioic acid hydratase in catechol pathway